MVIFSNLWGYLLGVLERLQFMRRDWEKIQGFGGGGDPKPNSSRFKIPKLWHLCKWALMSYYLRFSVCCQMSYQ